MVELLVKIRITYVYYYGEYISTPINDWNIKIVDWFGEIDVWMGIVLIAGFCLIFFYLGKMHNKILAMRGFHAGFSARFAGFSWIIPIANFWLPYQITREMLFNIQRFQNFRRPEIDDLFRGLKAIWFFWLGLKIVFWSLSFKMRGDLPDTDWFHFNKIYMLMSLFYVILLILMRKGVSIIATSLNDLDKPAYA